jgi:polyamine oxidase
VKITTDQGTTIVAQYAIVTFSSAVILEGHNTLFSPPLPDVNREAMASLSPGVYTKVFFQFPEKFWEDTEFIVTATPERGASPLWQSLDSNKLLDGSRIIFQTLTGDMGARAELSDDDAIKEEQLAYLRHVYGDAVPEPTDFHIARFLSDPLFKQCWADWTPETTPDVCDRMRAPILNSRQERNIYISGEATCRRYHGYTHGGLLSGRRDARDVLIALNYTVEREDACENQDEPSGGPPYGNQGNGNGGGNGGNGKGKGNQ